MVRCLTLAVMLILVCYVYAVPPGSRVRRGYNNSGHSSGGAGGRGFSSQGSSERDASTSRENGEESDDAEDDDDREPTYERDREGISRNENRHGIAGRRLG